MSGSNNRLDEHDRHLKHADFLREKVKARQTAQYTINLAFWTLLLVAVKFLDETETKVSPFLLVPLVAALVILHACWLYCLSKRNHRDGSESRRHRDAAVELLFPFPKAEPDPFEVRVYSCLRVREYVGINSAAESLREGSREQIVRQRAYELWEKDGHKADSATQDWLRAESEFPLPLLAKLAERVFLALRWPHFIELCVTIVLAVIVCAANVTRLRTSTTTVHLLGRATTNQQVIFVAVVELKGSAGKFGPSLVSAPAHSVTIRRSDGIETKEDNPEGEAICKTVDKPSRLVRCFTMNQLTVGKVDVTAMFDGADGVRPSIDFETFTIMGP